MLPSYLDTPGSPGATGRYRQPGRTASCSQLVRRESKSRLLERMRSKNSLVVPSLVCLSPTNTESLKTFAISPSYQSELSDCSFYPPTLAESRQLPVCLDIAEDTEASSSLGMLTTSYSQLCPCAMELKGSCPSCARGLSFPLSPVNLSEGGTSTHGLCHRLKSLSAPSAFRVYFSLGNTTSFSRQHSITTHRDVSVLHLLDGVAPPCLPPVLVNLHLDHLVVQLEAARRVLLQPGDQPDHLLQVQRSGLTASRSVKCLVTQSC